MTIEQIGILFSLILTILGWSVTAYYQRKILERQITAEREKEIRQVLIPRKLQELDTLKKWLEEGYKLLERREKLTYQKNISLRLLEKQRQEIDVNIQEWGLNLLTHHNGYGSSS
jgi:hypothetical protein